MKYVQQVRGRWIVRMVVPEELRDIIGQRELVHVGLPTETRAREKAAIGIINSFLMQIDEAQDVWDSLGEASKPTLASAAKEHYRAELLADDMANMTGTHRDHDAYLQFSRSVYAKKLRLLVAGRLGDDEAEALIGYAADALAANGRLPTKPRKELLRTLAEIQLEVLEHVGERALGSVKRPSPIHSLLNEPDPVPLSTSHSKAPSPVGMTLTDALASFHKERTAGVSTLAAKTMEEHRNSVRMFNEFMGSEVAVRSITKKNVIDYKQALLTTPNRYKMRFPGLTLPQAIKANSRLSTPFSTLAPKTINMKWLSHLSSILQWASNNGHVETNPAQGVRVDTGSKVHREPSYLPFTKDELTKIFGHAMFADPGAYGLNQWALLVMLYTGVRNSSEMARMKLKDIYNEQEVPVFFLAEASKNQRSKRFVPVHPDLITLGFLDYVAAKRTRGDEFLFPEWAKRPDKVNDWFNNTFLVALSLKSRKKVFYSFRHTLATELAKAGVPRELSKMISGHAPQEIASVYIHATPVTLMADALNKVRFDLPIPQLSSNR